jgi:HEAT repeat protein
MSELPLPDPDQLPTELLLRLALAEVEDDADGPVPFLVALQQRPDRETFDAAAALLHDSVAARRALGVRILRELGSEQPDGRRPFSAETITLLRTRLRNEPDPGVLRWIVSALGYHRAHEALPDVLALTAHPDARVRFHVASSLPSLADPTGVESDAADALIRLCQDDDADIRYYALYAATREVAGMNAEAMTNLTAELMNDPDEQIRMMAAEHHRAVTEVRRLLNAWDFIGVFDPENNTDEYDCMIGSLLASLAENVDAAGIRHLLDHEIRHHFGMSPAHVDTPNMARRLAAWWRGQGAR